MGLVSNNCVLIESGCVSVHDGNKVTRDRLQTKSDGIVAAIIGVDNLSRIARRRDISARF